MHQLKCVEGFFYTSVNYQLVITVIGWKIRLRWTALTNATIQLPQSILINIKTSL